jgi:Uma2 family endonuclease
MGAATLVSVEEYLNTSYRPDCDYVDGVVEERNLGERDQSRLQHRLERFLGALEDRLGIFVLPQQRVQVKPTRFRIPDICVMRSPTDEQIIRTAPFLCIEILSPRDTVAGTQERVDEFLRMGVSFVWVINPKTRDAYIYTPDGRIEHNKDGFLYTNDPDIQVRVGELGE